MQPLLLLHGAIGASTQLQPLAQSLSANHKVYTLDFSGHGSNVIGDEPFSIRIFAQDVLQFLEQQQLSKVFIFGYSMGGYVAMYLAKHHPEKIDKVITMATKYQWDGAIAAREIQMLNPEKIEQKLPAFAETLKQRHTSDWKQVLANTATMMTALGTNNPLKTEDYSTITTPTLLLLGDRDKMVTLDETVAIYKTLPTAQLGILPATPHPIEQVDIAILTFMIDAFLLN